MLGGITAPRRNHVKPDRVSSGLSIDGDPKDPTSLGELHAFMGRNRLTIVEANQALAWQRLQRHDRHDTRRQSA
jgi:hypothetical protein